MHKIKQLVSLYGIQILNGLVPLLVFPYVLSQTSHEYYSRFVLAEMFSIFALILVLWGFEITAVKNLRQYGFNSKLKKSVIFFNTLYCRLFFWIISFSIIIPLCFILFGSDFVIMAIGWLFIPLALAFYSTYYFLAIEENFVVFISLLIGRLSGVLFVFVVDFNTVDLNFIPYLISLPFLFVGFLLVFYMLFFKKLFFVKFRFKNKLIYIRDSMSVFKSMMSLSMVKEFNLPIVSMASGSPEITSLYSILDKFLRAASALMRPVAQLFTPGLISYIGRSNTWFFRFYFIKILLVGFFVIAVGVLLAFVFPLNILINDKVFYDYNLNLLLVIMLVSLFFGFVNYFFLVYSSFQGDNTFLYVTLLSGFFGLITLYFLTLKFGELGFAVAVIVPEVLISILFFCSLSFNRKEGL